MKRKESKFINVTIPTAHKLKYQGYCEFCGKDRFFRWTGGTITTTRYRCITCKNETEEYLFE